MTCFIAGSYECGYVECFSSIQLRITLLRDFAVFFPVHYYITFRLYSVIGVDCDLSHLLLQLAVYALSGCGVVACGILFSICSCARSIYVRHYLFTHRLGGACALECSFVTNTLHLIMVDYYDWFDSPYMSTGVGLCLLLSDSLLVSYGAYPASICGGGDFQYKHFFTVMFLFFALNFLTAVSTVLQVCLYGGILHYDTLNNVSLNFPSLLGVGLGALASCWSWLGSERVIRWRHLSGLYLVVSYLIIMYFLISPDTNIGEALPARRFEKYG